MGYTLIDNDLFDDRFISGQEKWLLVVLIRFWSHEKGYAYPSYETLMKKADMSKATLRKHLVSLELKRYIEIIKHRSKTVENNTYKINKYLCLENKLSYREEILIFDDSQSLEIKPSQSLKTKLDRVQKLNCTSTININTNNIYSSIINYLNKKAGTNYKANIKKTQSLINARLKEKYNELDFYRVIDIKVDEWKGKFNKDGVPMENYLRPSTLFGTKFEAYLNQKVSGKNRDFVQNNEKDTSELYDFSKYGG